jgi:hypothetical protein
VVSVGSLGVLRGLRWMVGRACLPLHPRMDICCLIDDARLGVRSGR